MPKGKYAQYLREKPRLYTTESRHQDKVDELKKALVNDSDYAPMRASTLAREYVAVREEKDKKNEELSAIQVRVDAIEQLLVEHMEAESLTSLKLETGRSISTWIEPCPRVVDKEAFRRWCIDNGLERSLQLWPSTTTSIIKERLQAGQPEPDGVEVYSRDVVRLGS